MGFIKKGFQNNAFDMKHILSRRKNMILDWTSVVTEDGDEIPQVMIQFVPTETESG